MTDQQELLRIAYHEAGHMVVAASYGIPIRAVMIQPDTDCNAAVMMDAAHLRDLEGLRHKADMYAAGGVSQFVFNGSDRESLNCQADRTELRSIATKIHGVMAPAEIIMAEMAGSYRRAEAILAARWPSVEELARFLLELKRQCDGVRRTWPGEEHQLNMLTAITLSEVRTSEVACQQKEEV